MDYNQDVIVLRDFLSESEVAELKEAIRLVRDNEQPEHEVLEFKHWSRINHGIHIPQSVFNKFQAAAHKYGDKSLKFTHQTSFRYQPDLGGTTQCPPHTDGNETQFSMDYQVDANVEWPLWVEGKKYVLGNNDVLIMSGRSQVHWREEKHLKDGEYCDMFILHFAEPGYLEKQEQGLIQNAPETSYKMAEEMYSPKLDGTTIQGNGPEDSKSNVCVSKDQIDHSQCSHD